MMYTKQFGKKGPGVVKEDPTVTMLIRIQQI
jgi:hypothetical protein